MDKESIFDEAVEEEEVESSRSLTSKRLMLRSLKTPLKIRTLQRSTRKTSLYGRNIRRVEIQK